MRGVAGQRLLTGDANADRLWYRIEKAGNLRAHPYVGVESRPEGARKRMIGPGVGRKPTRS